MAPVGELRVFYLSIHAPSRLSSSGFSMQLATHNSLGKWKKVYLDVLLDIFHLLPYTLFMYFQLYNLVDLLPLATMYL